MLRLRWYTKIVLKHTMLALGVFIPQFVWSLASDFPCQDHVYSSTDKSFGFHNKKINKKSVVNWITLRIRVFSRNTQPHLKAGLGFVRNESANSVESSFQGISSNWFLWKQNKLSVVIQTWSWRGKPATSIDWCCFYYFVRNCLVAAGSFTCSIVDLCSQFLEFLLETNWRPRDRQSRALTN